MSRMFMFLYGVFSYLCFLVTYLYFLGFLGNLYVPITLDGPVRVPIAWAVLNNLGLVLIFGLQHSVMARPGFKRVWTTIIPQAAERSTYVFLSSIALFALCWFWQPMGGTIWRVDEPILRAVIQGLFAIGCLMVPAASLLINHFDLFGLRQTWLHLRKQPYTHLAFSTPGPYRFIRHPLYVGWLMTFWATPDMTVTHMVLAVSLTVYILVAIRYEERDLAAFHGEPYIAYRQRTPMFVPGAKSAPSEPGESEVA